MSTRQKFVVILSSLSLMFVVVFILIMKTAGLLGPVSDRDKGMLSNVSSRKYDLKDEGIKIEGKDTLSEIMANDQKLKAFARAFMNVQSYLNKAGRDASYADTTKIVLKHGLSVEDYTRMSTFMNEYPAFRKKIFILVDEFESESP